MDRLGDELPSISLFYPYTGHDHFLGKISECKNRERYTICDLIRRLDVIKRIEPVTKYVVYHRDKSKLSASFTRSLSNLFTGSEEALIHYRPQVGSRLTSQV